MPYAMNSTPPAFLLGTLTRSSGIQQLSPVSAARDSGFIVTDSEPPPSSRVLPTDNTCFVSQPLSEKLLQLREGQASVSPGSKKVQEDLTSVWAPLYLEMTCLMRACYSEPLMTEPGDRAELATFLRHWRRDFEAVLDKYRNGVSQRNLEMVWMLTEKFLGCRTSLSEGIRSRFRPSQYNMIAILCGLPPYGRSTAPLVETIGACFEGALYLARALESLETVTYGSPSQPPSSSNF